GGGEGGGEGQGGPQPQAGGGEHQVARGHARDDLLAAVLVGQRRDRQVVPGGDEAGGDLGLAQGGLELGHVGVALGRVLGQAAHDHRFERGGDLELGSALSQGDGGLVYLLLEHVLEVLVVERRLAHEQLVGGAAEGVDVEAAVEVLAEHLLGGHVVRGSGDAHAAIGAGGEHGRDPEVDDLHG